MPTINLKSNLCSNRSATHVGEKTTSVLSMRWRQMTLAYVPRQGGGSRSAMEVGQMWVPRSVCEEVARSCPVMLGINATIN